MAIVHHLYPSAGEPQPGGVVRGRPCGEDRQPGDHLDRQEEGGGDFDDDDDDGEDGDHHESWQKGEHGPSTEKGSYL